MSMRVLSVLQFLQMLVAYSIVTLLIPGYLLKERLKYFSLPERITGYFLAGNFYCINLVFLLQFLHISCRVTLVAGSVFPLLLKNYQKQKGLAHFKELFSKALYNLKAILSGTYGVKTAIADIVEKLPHRSLKGKKKWVYLPDVLLFLIAIAGILYIYGPNNFTEYGYKASDMPVHNYWINLMDSNQIFKMGVYPHGFHCMIYYLHVVFNIKTYILLRLFSLVQVIFIHLAIIICLKMLCKARFTPYIGFGIYLMVDLFGRHTYTRYASTLPQEYGMLFILPTACFAIRFFDEYAAALKEKDTRQKKLRIKKSRWYLLGLIISFSLTLTVHFYNTMVAGYLCFGIAMGYFFRILRWRYLKQILISGIVSIVLAVVPMAVGVAMGNPLQGSLGWGLNVISGKNNSSDATADTNGLSTKKTVITTDSGKKITVVGDVDEESLARIKKQIEEEENSNETFREEDGKEQEIIEEPVKTKKEILEEKFKAVLNGIQVNVANNQQITVWCMIGGAVILLILGLFSFLVRRVDYGAMLWSMGFYTLIMCIMQTAGALGLPTLMDASRNSIFFAYTIVVIWALDVDAVIYLLFGWFKKNWMMSITSFVILVMAGDQVMQRGLVKEPIYVSALETNGAITCVTNIMNENKDFTWTIVSANDELRMTDEYGYHYETIEFLRDMKNPSSKKALTIPTDNVYFFIEKQPINYSGTANGLDLGSISEEYAKEPVPTVSGIGAYQGRYRWVTMSHMYYWAQKFMELYPNEMEVYYESSDFICYKVRQNGYSLYNFAIDYGYNNPQETTEESTEAKKQEAE